VSENNSLGCSVLGSGGNRRCRVACCRARYWMGCINDGGCNPASGWASMKGVAVFLLMLGAILALTAHTFVAAVLSLLCWVGGAFAVYRIKPERGP
jgi:hypothetical protein